MAFKLMACGPHRKNVTHNIYLSKVNHFYIEIPSYLKVTAETVVFFPKQILTFLILQNNAAVHRPYFKLGLCMVE